jgi:hypothetical protein
MKELNKEWHERAEEYAHKACDNDGYHATISDMKAYAKEDYIKGAFEMQQAILKKLQSDDVQSMPLFDKGEIFEEIIKIIKNIKP